MSQDGVELKLPFVPAHVELAGHFDEQFIDQLVGERIAPLRAELEQKAQQQREALLAEIGALKQAVRAFAAAHDELAAAREQTLAQAAEAAVILVDRIARRLLEQTLSESPETLLRLAERAVRTNRSATLTGPLTLHVHPEVQRVLESHASVDELATLVGADVSVVGDEQVEPGAVLIESEGDSLWIDPNKELEWLVEALWASLRELPG